MKNKVFHAIYIITSWIPDFYLIDNYLKKLRAIVLNFQSNKTIGYNCQIYTGVKIWSSTQLILGNNTKIKEKVVIGGKCKIGDNSQVLSNTLIDASGMVTIGSDTQIGRQNTIYSHNHDISSKNEKMIHSKEVFAPVIIGDDVMLFSKVSVMAGVNIASGCAFAYGSVVTKDTEEYCIYAGLPAINERK